MSPLTQAHPGDGEIYALKARSSGFTSPPAGEKPQGAASTSILELGETEQQGSSGGCSSRTALSTPLQRLDGLKRQRQRMVQVGRRGLTDDPVSPGSVGVRRAAQAPAVGPFDGHVQLFRRLVGS